METLKSALGSLTQSIPAPLRETAMVRAFGFFKIPLIFFISPSILELTPKRTVMRVPLNRRTRNHLKSMYFGVLCTGADVAGGLVAVKLIHESGRRIDFVFKDFEAKFLKRVEDDCVFTCDAGEIAAKAVEAAIATGERQNVPLPVVATVPSKFGDEPVATFTLTLSMKLRG